MVVNTFLTSTISTVQIEHFIYLEMACYMHVQCTVSNWFYLYNNLYSHDMTNDFKWLLNLPLRFWTGGLKCPYNFAKSMPNTENGNDTKNMYQINFDMFDLFLCWFLYRNSVRTVWMWILSIFLCNWIYTEVFDCVGWCFSFCFIFPMKLLRFYYVFSWITFDSFVCWACEFALQKWTLIYAIQLLKHM